MDNKNWGIEKTNCGIDHPLNDLKKRFQEIKNTDIKKVVEKRTYGYFPGKGSCAFVSRMEVNDGQVLCSPLEELLTETKDFLNLTEDTSLRGQVEGLIGEIQRFCNAISSAPLSGRIIMPNGELGRSTLVERDSQGAPVFPRRRFHGGV